MRRARVAVALAGAPFLALYVSGLPFYAYWLATRDPPLFPVLKEVAEKHVPAFLYAVYLSGRRGWEAVRWLAVLVCAAAGFSALSMLVAVGNVFVVQGYRWQWAAIAVWSLAGLLLLMLTRGLPPLRGVAASYSGVLFASVLYEVPWIAANDGWAIFLTPKWSLSAVVLALAVLDGGAPNYALLSLSTASLTLFSAGWAMYGWAPWFARLPAALLVLSLFLGDPKSAPRKSRKRDTHTAEYARYASNHDGCPGFPKSQANPATATSRRGRARAARLTAASPLCPQDACLLNGSKAQSPWLGGRRTAGTCSPARPASQPSSPAWRETCTAYTSSPQPPAQP